MLDTDRTMLFPLCCVVRWWLMSAVYTNIKKDKKDKNNKYLSIQLCVTVIIYTYILCAVVDEGCSQDEGRLMV
jgi:hypothetical protein